MGTLIQDLRYAVRQLRDNPTFAAVAILTLALGIGVSTALFSVIDAALLRPLPYDHPEQLVTVTLEERPATGEPSRLGPSMADIRAWRTLSDTIAHAGMGRVTGFSPLIVETGTPQRLIVGEASDGFLETYGVVPVLGRAISVDDTRAGAAKVALLGHAFWMQEFGGDRNVLGRTITIQNEPVTIVGVLPAGFYKQTDVWQPSQFSSASLEARGSGTPAIARLRAGVSLAQATRALDAVTRGGTTGTETPMPTRVILSSMYEDETFGFASTIRVLSMAVALIVVIACVNVAGLLLARGVTRDIEFAIRASIGASRTRLVRQLLTESLLLAVAGAILGVVLAYVSLDSLVALIPLSLPSNSPVAIDATALGFALGLSVVTAVIFGLIPALKLSRPPTQISTTLAAGGRSGVRLSRRASQSLIAIEVAVALVLMTGSGLLLRSFVNLVTVDLGYDASKVLTLDVEPLEPTFAMRRQYYTGLADTLRQLPEVVAVGAISQLGLKGDGSYGSAIADTGAEVEGFQHTVLPGYFQAMGIGPLAGRLLEDADLVRGEAIVVNQATAREFFAGDAVGHTVRTPGKSPRVWRVVGIVANVKHGGPGDQVGPTIYVLPDPKAQPASELALAMVIRLRDDRPMTRDRLEQAAESVSPRVLVGAATPADSIVREQVASPRHRMLLLTMFSVLGLLLTVVGISSVTAYAVSRRTREIGVRMAFGARPAQVIGIVVRDTVWPAALGIVAGLAGTYYATQTISAFLFEITPHDPATFIAAAVVLAAAAALAAWVPARRAALVDPVTALRAD